MDFDVNRLSDALNAERERRGLTWAQLMREINPLFKEVPGTRPVSASTVTGMRGKRVNEGDGVLQMLRWLDQSPESFIPGRQETRQDKKLPNLPTNQILRFDLPSIHAALDRRRIKLGLTWKQVAEQIGQVRAEGLQRMSTPGRTSIQDAARIAGWLGVPVAKLTRASNA